MGTQVVEDQNTSGDDAAPKGWARIFISDNNEKTYLRMGAVADDEGTDLHPTTVASLTLPNALGTFDYTQGARVVGTGDDRTDLMGGDRVDLVAGKAREVVAAGQSVADQSLTIASDAAGTTRLVLAGGKSETIAGGHSLVVESGDQSVTVSEGKQTFSTGSGKQSLTSAGTQTFHADGGQTVDISGNETSTFWGGRTQRVAPSGTQNWHFLSGHKVTATTHQAFSYGLYFELSPSKLRAAAILHLNTAGSLRDYGVCRTSAVLAQVAAALYRTQMNVWWFGYTALAYDNHFTKITQGNQAFMTA